MIPSWFPVNPPPGYISPAKTSAIKQPKQEEALFSSVAIPRFGDTTGKTVDRYRDFAPNLKSRL